MRCMFEQDDDQSELSNDLYFQSGSEDLCPCLGIDVEDMSHSGRLIIRPVTTTGEIAQHCFIEISSDPRTLQAIANLLSQCANNSYPETQQFCQDIENELRHKLLDNNN